MYHFVFSGDENYLKYISLSITSIVKNTDVTRTFSSTYRKTMHDTGFDGEQKTYKNNNIHYTFHILSDSISLEMKEKLHYFEEALNTYCEQELQAQKINDVSFCVNIKTYIMADDIFHGQAKWRGNYLAYYRLKTSFLLNIDCEKLLYLDGDILVNCDIRELFQYNIQNSICAVVSNNYPVKYELEARFSQKNYSFSSSQFYFNSGVMLINFPKWKEERIEEKALQFLQTYIPKAPDQDALNAVIEKVLPLPYKWNVMVHTQFISEHSLAYHCRYKDDSIEFNNPHTQKDYVEGLANPHIIHYAKKPWKGKGLIITKEHKVAFYPYFDMWWNMASKTPVFGENLLAIKESDAYKEAINKEEKSIQMLKTKSFAFYYYCLKQKIKPFSKKIEIPFKKIRNYFRSRKVRKKSIS